MVDTMETVNKELRKRRFWSKVEGTCERVGTFLKDHEEEIKTVAPVAVPLGGMLVRSVLKQRKTQKELNMKKLWHYDPRDGEYYVSRRPLKSWEKLKLRELYESGMSKGEALRKMKLLGK